MSILALAIAFAILPQIVIAEQAYDKKNEVLDFRLSPAIGYFFYPQMVDGGYYVDGNPYNLIWSGAQLNFQADVQFFIPRVHKLSLGVGGGFLAAPNPVASDAAQTVNVNLGGAALGGYVGMGMSYRIIQRLRFGLLVGYGGTGLSDNGDGFGGTGAILSPSVDFLFPLRSVIGGVGLRALIGFLNYPATGTVRAESGTYIAFMVDAPWDWVPRF
jgi:hypothetical protein